MQTTVYSDNMALWYFTGLCSTLGFLSVYSVLSCTFLKKKNNKTRKPNNLKWFLKFKNVSGDVNFTDTPKH